MADSGTAVLVKEWWIRAREVLETSFKNEENSSSTHPKEAVPWIKEIELAMSVDDLKKLLSASQGRVIRILQPLMRRSIKH